MDSDSPNVLEMQKPQFKKGMEKLSIMIRSLDRPEFAYLSPYELGCLNGMLMAEALLKGKSINDCKLRLPPKKWLGQVNNNNLTKEKENEGTNHSNIQRKRGSSNFVGGKPPGKRVQKSDEGAPSVAEHPSAGTEGISSVEKGAGNED